ncbi:hypothetical protein [Nocardioides cynanchi]|uniref:hypothetical protein n=1 Tax=Nocardioides cynanchi TaxID=2558918 RepID=UPI001248DF46|nr:hypothetical protein [Nocardioides cynanchi]
MNGSQRRVSKTSSWRSLGAAVLLLSAAGTALTTTTAGAATNGHRSTVRAAGVCGTLTPDATFRAEANLLGTEHACEHLKERAFVETRADRVAMKAAHTAAVAALPTTDPAVIGAWSDASNPGTKTIGISAVMLHTGKVLIFGGKYKATDKNTASYLFDPVTGTGHEVPAPAAVFCGSVVQLSDGRVLSVGGPARFRRGSSTSGCSTRSPSSGSGSPTARWGGTTRPRPSWPTARSSSRPAPNSTG